MRWSECSVKRLLVCVQMAAKLRCPVSKFIAHTLSHVFFLTLLALATFGARSQVGHNVVLNLIHDNDSMHDDG